LGGQFVAVVTVATVTWPWLGLSRLFTRDEDIDAGQVPLKLLRAGETPWPAWLATISSTGAWGSATSDHPLHQMK